MEGRERMKWYQIWTSEIIIHKHNGRSQSNSKVKVGRWWWNEEKKYVWKMGAYLRPMSKKSGFIYSGAGAWALLDTVQTLNMRKSEGKKDSMVGLWAIGDGWVLSLSTHACISSISPDSTQLWDFIRQTCGENFDLPPDSLFSFLSSPLPSISTLLFFSSHTFCSYSFFPSSPLEGAVLVISRSSPSPRSRGLAMTPTLLSPLCLFTSSLLPLSFIRHTLRPYHLFSQQSH